MSAWKGRAPLVLSEPQELRCLTISGCQQKELPGPVIALQLANVNIGMGDSDVKTLLLSCWAHCIRMG